MALWVLFGAVRGADDWQVSGGGYTVALLVAGGAFGLLLAPPTEPRHLATGTLLVVPGLATLVAAGPGAHPGAVWWYVTLLLGLFGAAGTHRVAVELRRAVRSELSRLLDRRSALADGPDSR